MGHEKGKSVDCRVIYTVRDAHRHTAVPLLSALRKEIRKCVCMCVFVCV